MAGHHKRIHLKSNDGSHPCKLTLASHCRNKLTVLLLQVVASQRPEYAQQDQQTICADAAQQARALPITLLEQRHRQWFVLCDTHRIQHPQVFCRRVFDVHELLMALQPQEVVRSLSTLVLLPRRRYSSHLSVWPRIQLGACRGVTPAMLIVDSTSFLLAPIWSLKSITSCCIVAEARAPPVFDFPNFQICMSACQGTVLSAGCSVAATCRHYLRRSYSVYSPLRWGRRLA